MKIIKFGIQGGRGSFNEEAVNFYLTKKKIKNYKIVYLYTSEKVLKKLNLGEIDFGLFAVCNLKAGLVLESIKAMGRYRFKMVDQVILPICHFLMKRKDIKKEEIKKIMAHPQVFFQCRNNLRKKYPHLKLISGQGDLINTAKAAEVLYQGKIDKKTAILGSKKLAEIFNFEIIDTNLQDQKDNRTIFLVVKK